VPIAKKNVTTSMANRPVRPMNGSKAPASSGATTPGPASISDIRPLARPNCSFGIIVLMAAE